MVDEKREIGIIVTYPEKGKKHSDFSGIAGYTKNLLSSLPKRDRSRVVVFSNIKKHKNLFNDFDIEVNECWERGKLSFDEEIIQEIKKYPNLKLIHIQHEFNLFGGSLTILKYLALLKKLKRLNKKIIVTYHGFASQKIIDKNFNKINQIGLPNFVIKRLFKFVFNASSKYIDQVIVHEQYFKESLINEYGFKPERIVVIPHGVESELKSMPKQQARDKLKLPPKKIIMFFGFLAGYKGVDILVDAFKELNRKNNGYVLILAGGKPKRTEKDRKYTEWYNQLEEKIKNNPGIIATGFIKENDICAYYSAVDVLILPYLYMLSASGPMNLAIAYELPFLASDAFENVWGKIFPNIIFKRNPESLKNKIQEFFKNKKYFAKDIHGLKNQRSWKNIAKKTWEVWRR